MVVIGTQPGVPPLQEWCLKPLSHLAGPSSFFVFIFETGSHYVALASLLSVPKQQAYFNFFFIPCYLCQTICNEGNEK